MELDLEAPAHAVPEELRLCPSLGAQDDSFSDRQADAPTNQIVRQLDHGSCSQLSRVDNCIAECIEERLHLFVSFEISGCQHL